MTPVSARGGSRRWLVRAGLASVFLVGAAVLAQQLLPLRTIFHLVDDSGCTPSLASVRLPDRTASQDGRWKLKWSYPTARDEVRAAEVGGRVYVGTGLVLRNGSLRSLDEMYRFDPARGVFQTLPDVPERVDHAAFVGNRGDLYVIGGYVDGEPTAAVWRFSTRTRRWSALPPMRISRGAPAAAVIKGKIYVVGGSSQALGKPVAVSDLEIYDIAARKWSRGPSMRTPRHHHGAAALGGRLIVAGGRGNDDLSLNTVEQFDPSTNRWTRLAPLPVGVGGLAVVAAAGQIIAIGGGDDEEQWVSPATWALGPNDTTWRRLADLNLARHGHGAAAVGPDVYVFGGAPCPGYGRTNAVESLHVTDGTASP